MDGGDREWPCLLGGDEVYRLQLLLQGASGSGLGSRTSIWGSGRGRGGGQGQDKISLHHSLTAVELHLGMDGESSRGPVPWHLTEQRSSDNPFWTTHALKDKTTLFL